ncbi:MAG: sigma-70 family RNA polymerase sigma factor, partial [Planctomicrobium sp.]|nr:sigma-70 family RNA polymerase sigma factor [Planctomicrobium sp.]
GIDFKTFAYQRIRGAVFDELRRNCPLPQHILQHWALIREVVQSHEETVSPDSISKQTGLSVGEVETCLSAIRMTAPETWHEELVSKQEESQQDELEEVDRQQLLTQAIEELPKQRREIITLYHMDQLTLKQIGEVVGLSESRVSRILAQAELTLKKRLQHLENSVSMDN